MPGAGGDLPGPARRSGLTASTHDERRSQGHTLLYTDWSSGWDSLPEVPDLVSRRKTAQVTLRLPASLLARIKLVAAARSLPYHALTRSWLVDGLRRGDAGQVTASVREEETQGEQLNIKLDQGLLDELKARASELRRPYHRLAREWIESAVTREEEALDIKALPRSDRR
ncbi:MAG: hypothetical protein ACRDFX_03050 [Chloroflexota bacterium]